MEGIDGLDVIRLGSGFLDGFRCDGLVLETQRMGQCRVGLEAVGAEHGVPFQVRGESHMDGSFGSSGDVFEAAPAAAICDGENDTLPARQAGQHWHALSPILAPAQPWWLREVCRIADVANPFP